MLQAVWALVLARYSKESDVLFGYTVSGRASTDVDGLESMVGLFINTLPLRVKTDPTHKLHDWLQWLHETHSESIQYQSTPLSKIQAWSDLTNRQTGLFESILVYENYPIDATVSAHQSLLNIHSAEAEEHPSFPLTVVVSPTTKSLQLVLLYDTGRFSSSNIQMLTETTIEMLTTLVNADIKSALVDDVTRLPDSQLHLYKQWNDNHKEVPPGTIVEHFMRWAQQKPDSIAAVYEDEVITYAELDARSNQLARYLNTKVGVVPGSYVGVCMYRSLEMLVSFLAIWKLAGVYVPIDPTYPEARKRFLIENARCVIVLTQQQTYHSSWPEPSVR